VDSVGTTFAARRDLCYQPGLRANSFLFKTFKVILIEYLYFNLFYTFIYYPIADGLQ
jgi:hypothetical protein